MTKFSTLVLGGIAVVFITLATPSNSNAQVIDDNGSVPYPPGNRLFDRWIDNRRATHGRIIPQLMVSQFSAGSGYANGIVPPLDSAPWHWNPAWRESRVPLLPWRRR